MAWNICAAKNDLHRKHKRSEFFDAVMLCSLSKGILALPNCFLPESPKSTHLKTALVKFSLHTLKEKQQVFVFHCVSVHPCPGLLRGSKEQPAPTVQNPALAPQKKAALLWSCSLLAPAGPLLDQERTVKVVYSHLLQEGSQWKGVSAPFE